MSTESRRAARRRQEMGDVVFPLEGHPASLPGLSRRRHRPSPKHQRVHQRARHEQNGHEAPSAPASGAAGSSGGSAGSGGGKSDTCDACIAAASSGNISGAAFNFKSCTDAAKKAQCSNAAKKQAPKLAANAAKLGQCGQANAIISAAKAMDASTPKLDAALKDTTCAK